jgi:copper oxidase (laccase) domain-containing protein
MFNLLNLFKKNKQSDEIDMSYFDCEDSVEAALNYLDNHPDCTLEEYEEWLSHREEAVKEIKENWN